MFNATNTTRNRLGGVRMNVTVKILDTFPQHDTFAIARVTIDSIMSLLNVKLKRDKEGIKYLLDCSDFEDLNSFVELQDDTLVEKIYDAMVYQYEQHVIAMFNRDVDDEEYREPSYIYFLEKKRIERKDRKRNYAV